MTSVKKVKAAFAEWSSQYEKISQRNKAHVPADLVDLLVTARNNGITPKQLSEATGISVYKIHKLVLSGKRIRHEAEKADRRKERETRENTHKENKTNKIEDEQERLTVFWNALFDWYQELPKENNNLHVNGLCVRLARLPPGVTKQTYPKRFYMYEEAVGDIEEARSEGTFVIPPDEYIPSEEYVAEWIDKKIKFVL